MSFLFNKKELKISVECLSICGGNCNGCFLTPEMRASSSFWSEDKLDKVGVFIKDFIDFHEKREGVDDVGVTLGQGDYAQLKPEQIKMLINKADSWLNENSSLFITTSGITNKNKFKESMDVFYDESLKVERPLTFDVVLNASKLSGNIVNTYEQNLNYLIDRFGIFDLNINMGIDVMEIIPIELLRKFLSENKITYITINYIPTVKNNINTVKETFDWLIDFLELSKEFRFFINYLDTTRRMLESFNLEEITNQDYIDGLVKVHQKNIYIDYYGNLFLQQEGIGDMALTDRSGFEPIINLFDSNLSIVEIMNKIENYVKNKIKKDFISYQKNSKCSSCNYQKVCMGTLGSLTKKVVPDINTLDNCLLEKFFNTIEKYEFKNRFKQCPIFYQKNLNSKFKNEQNKFDFYGKINLLRTKD